MHNDEKNKRIYAEKGVASHYASVEGLQPGEEAIVASLGEGLGHATMLDIGVGGGRTTEFFAPRVARYVGVDYSEAMIEAAKERFPPFAAAFQIADARALPFGDGDFTFTLFSYNGIDYVDHADRVRVLSEVRRVTARGGLFAFSTHNLARDDLDFEARPTQGLLSRVLGAPKRARLRAENVAWPSFSAASHAMLNDGSFRYRAATYHIRCEAQIQQAHDAGFADVRVYSGRTGRELPRSSQDEPGDPWLYFACR